ncbi:MAG: gliding motility-associated C-terminal domain-containing protein [Flavobacteriales bacterium]|nr:gliding motility-associated C-terminal domain-containing protein [Flavobacteriales bacterium]
MATHLIGGYMYYEFLQKDNDEYVYKVSLYLFRDKEQSEVDFDEEILLGVYFNNANLDKNQTARVKLIYRKDVKPPGNAECDYYADKEIEMAFYEKVIRLQAYTEGYHLNFVRCCRNMQDNLINDNGKPFQGQTYYCFIPNPALRNSSPRFSGVPSPYMCAKDTTTFLNRAVDPDGDSLVYRFVWPWQGGEPSQGGAMPEPPTRLRLPIDPVQYVNGFSFKTPFGANGFADVNQANGLTTLFAPNEGSFVIAIEVSEYRNGILLSTVRLDMQILVLKCDPNKKPQARSSSGKHFEIEAGETLCFNVEGLNSDDPPQDVTIFATGDIMTGENGYKGPRAKMATKTGSNYVITEFCWTPSCDEARVDPYLVAMTARDNGCPPKEDHINIEIVVNPFKGSDAILGPDRACSGSSALTTYNAKDPSTGTSFYWKVNGGKIVGRSDSSAVQVQWTGTGIGRLKMVEISRFGCPGDTVTKDITLVQSPQEPTIGGKDTVCLFESNVPYSVNPNAGNSFVWLLPDGSSVNNTGSKLLHTWNALGTFEIAVVEINPDGCVSDTARFEVNVRKPAPGIVGPRSVCPNSSGVVYQAYGYPGSSYQWTIVGGTKVSGGNGSIIKVDWGNEGAGRVEVIETDKFGCQSDVIRYVVDKTYNLAGVDPVGDQSVCEFDANIPYTVVEASGSIYRWSVSGGNQVAGDSSSAIKVTWGATGLGKVGVQEWAWDAVNQRECVSPVKSIDININPIPTADKINGNFEVCQSEDKLIYSVSGFSGSTYHWVVNGNDQNITGQGTSTIQLTWNFPGTFPVSVQELSKDSCPGQLIDTFMVVHPKPTSDKIVGDPVVCVPNNLTTNYEVTGFPNSTFNWWVTNGSIVQNNNSSVVIDWAESGYGSVRVVEISEYGCVGDTLDLPVYINNIQVDLKVVSVGFPDDRMHGQFDVLYDDLTSTPFRIQKRTSASDPGWLDILSEPNKSFLETGINTDIEPFDYRVVATDLCGNQHVSDQHTNVLLTGTQDEEDFSIILNFTPYIGWDNGVQQYELHKSVNADRVLRFDQTVTLGDAIFVDGNSSDYRQCFRIRAIEDGGGNTTSWSNEICFYFSPNVYVPTAFTPNKDGINDAFHPVSVAVQDYQLEIYNRWGERVYQTQNQFDSWDGTYNGVNAPAGVYMYVLKFSDYRQQTFQKSGTIHLMR